MGKFLGIAVFVKIRVGGVSGGQGDNRNCRSITEFHGSRNFCRTLEIPQPFDHIQWLVRCSKFSLVEYNTIIAHIKKIV